jgi:hypothetical protein
LTFAPIGLRRPVFPAIDRLTFENQTSNFLFRLHKNHLSHEEASDQSHGIILLVFDADRSNNDHNLEFCSGRELTHLCLCHQFVFEVVSQMLTIDVWDAHNS